MANLIANLFNSSKHPLMSHPPRNNSPPCNQDNPPPPPLVPLPPPRTVSQLTFTCTKSTIEALEKGVKHVQR